MNKLITLLLLIVTPLVPVQANEIEQLDKSAALSKQELINIAEKIKNDSKFIPENISPYWIELRKRPEIFNTDRKRLSIENKILLAKTMRYDSCISTLSLYFKKAKEAKELAVENSINTKDKWLNYISSTAGLHYPYTEKEMASTSQYPDIVALENAWQYKNNSKEGVLKHFNACIHIPLQRYIDNL